MYYDEFPNCCGIGVFVKFGKYNAQDFKYLKSVIQDLKQEIKENKKDCESEGIVMAVLNNGQMKDWAKSLKSLGFKRLQTATNPKHNSILNVFSLVLKPTRRGMKLPY